MKIQDLQSKPDGFLIQEVLRATAREVGAVEMKPGYNNGPAESNQRIRLSDDTGTITAYLTGGQEIHVGDVLDICAIRGQRGVSGAAVKHAKSGGQPYLALYARGVRVAGVSRQQASAPEDPWFMQDKPQQGQTAPPARPQQARLPLPAQSSGRRTSREMEEWLLGVTERLFVGLSDGLTNSAPEGARLECAQAMAVSLGIAVGRGEIDYIPESRPAPSRDNPLPLERPLQEAPPFEAAEDTMDWGPFGAGEGN